MQTSPSTQKAIHYPYTYAVLSGVHSVDAAFARVSVSLLVFAHKIALRAQTFKCVSKSHSQAAAAVPSFAVRTVTTTLPTIKRRWRTVDACSGVRRRQDGATDADGCGDE